VSTTGNTPTVPASASPPVTVVRSEEQLAIATTVQVRGAVRLHKRIITETITKTVEVRREELIVTDLTPDEISLQATLAAEDTNQLREREFDVILHQEQVVVTTEVVPVERIRVRVHVVTEQTHVEESLRQEHVGLLDDRVPLPPT